MHTVHSLLCPIYIFCFLKWLCIFFIVVYYYLMYTFAIVIIKKEGERQTSTRSSNKKTKVILWLQWNQKRSQIYITSSIQLTMKCYGQLRKRQRDPLIEKKGIKFVFIFYLNDKSGFKLDKKILFYVSYHNSLRLSIISLCDCSARECTYIHTDVAPYHLSSKPSFYHLSSKTKLFMCIIHINRSWNVKNFLLLFRIAIKC